MRTLSTCSIFDISLRICCCTFATLRGFAHTMRSGVTAFGCAPFRAACVTRKGAASEVARTMSAAQRRRYGRDLGTYWSSASSHRHRAQPLHEGAPPR